MNKILITISIFSAILAFESCKQPTVAEQKFLSEAALDSAVSPGENFFMYANGKWYDSAKIPSTENGVGSFQNLQNSTRVRLKGILDSISKTNSAAGSIEQKVGDLYAAAMDSTTIEKRGLDPVKPYLAQIATVNDAAGVLKYVTAQQVINNGILFEQYFNADDKNSAVNIAVYSQGGLGLPDRDYYFKTDAATLDVIEAYQSYLKTLFMLAGDDSALAIKKTLLTYELEKQLAGSHKTNIELRDPESNYHKLPVALLNNQMPVFAWKNTLVAMGVSADTINVQQPAFFNKLNDLLKSASIDSWKAYLQAHTLINYANILSSPFINAAFLYRKTLTGQQVMKSRADRMVDLTDRTLGEALGQLYVKQYFTADAKKRMLDLVNNLQISFENRINNLPWMSDSTKVKAKEKLHTFIKKIGFPDKWRDYSKVDINKNTFFENLQSAAKNEYQYQLSKVGKPVDKTEWGMSPPTINAYYNPSVNEIVFPAGILQFPFFDGNADDAVNYGGIGVVIGHEMTHGFDDQGAQYDKDGNLKNWWSKEDNSKFKEKTNAVAKQYDGFVVLDTLHVKGALTNGENIADMGGVAIAYDAFKLTKQGKDTVKINGLTPNQRFFLSFAQIWQTKLKDQRMRMLVNTNPHSPAIWRVNGPLMNFVPFYAAFNIKEGDKMYKNDSTRIKIW